MQNNPYAIYEAIAAGVKSEESISSAHFGKWWSMVESGNMQGIAMSTPGESIAPMYERMEGLSLKEAAKAVSSWNLSEASLALAAANAYYNSPERLEALGAFEPYDNYCTAGLELEGRTVALIGHLRGPAELREKAKQVYIIERSPLPGDYPDAACDFILPKCDLVLITGSSLINKTLPHLLELCKNAYTILIGPSVPMCPELLELGIDRLSGMVVRDKASMKAHAKADVEGTPYIHGTSFLLKK